MQGYAIQVRRLYDGHSHHPMEHTTMVIEEGKIQAIFQGDASHLDLPTYTFADHTIIPGLIDAHVHLNGSRSYGYENITVPKALQAIRATKDARSLLQAGYTSVRDVGSVVALSLKVAIDAEEALGPNIYAAGRIISQTGGHADSHSLPLSFLRSAETSSRLADGPEECRLAVREMIREGADLIKICTTGGVGSEKDHPHDVHYTMEEIRAITEEAHRAGRRVASHAQGTDGVKRAILGGVDTIEHGYFLDDEAIELMLQHQVMFVPTLALARVYAAAMKNPYDMPTWRLKKQEEALEHMVESFRKAYQKGVPIAAGADFLGSKLREHGRNSEELLAMTQWGMTPAEALHASTLQSARVIGIENETGSLEVGKRADFVVIKGNPLNDISLIQTNVEYIGKNGTLYEKETLHAVEKQPFLTRPNYRKMPLWQEA